jgi:hypothetical protein
MLRKALAIEEADTAWSRTVLLGAVRQSEAI